MLPYYARVTGFCTPNFLSSRISASLYTLHRVEIRSFIPPDIFPAIFNLRNSGDLPYRNHVLQSKYHLGYYLGKQSKERRIDDPLIHEWVATVKAYEVPVITLIKTLEMIKWSSEGAWEHSKPANPNPAHPGR
jgi:hypothetical protein